MNFTCQSVKIKVNGIMLNNLRYSDDTIILFCSAQELQVLQNIASISRNKIFHYQYHNRIIEMKLVKTFQYLETAVNNTWDPEHE